MTPILASASGSGGVSGSSFAPARVAKGAYAMGIEPSPPGTQLASADEQELLDGLCRGDERAFVTLLARYHGPLLRLALLYVPSRAVAEEVVQETWLGVLQGLGRFEGRASLKTWIFRILVNRARTRGEREGRSVAFSDLISAELGGSEPTVEPDQFWPADHPLWANIWVSYPRPLPSLPGSRRWRELWAQIQRASACSMRQRVAKCGRASPIFWLRTWQWSCSLSTLSWGGRSTGAEQAIGHSVAHAFSSERSHELIR